MPSLPKSFTGTPRVRVQGDQVVAARDQPESTVSLLVRAVGNVEIIVAKRAIPSFSFLDMVRPEG